MADRRRNLRRNLGLLGFILLVLASCGLLSYLHFGRPGFVFTTGGLVLFVVFVRMIDQTIVPGMDELHSDERKAIRGAKAEEKIGALLDQLSADSVLCPDVKTDCGNI